MSSVLLISSSPSHLGLQILFHARICILWFYYCQHYQSKIYLCLLYQFVRSVFWKLEPIHRVLRNTYEIRTHRNNFTCRRESLCFPSSKFLAQFPSNIIEVLFCPSVLFRIDTSKIRVNFIRYRDLKTWEILFLSAFDTPLEH